MDRISIIVKLPQMRRVIYRRVIRVLVIGRSVTLWKKQF